MKKTLKSTVAVLLCAAAIASFSACGEEDVQKPKDTTVQSETPKDTANQLVRIDTVKLDKTVEEAKAAATDAGCIPVVITVYDDTKSDGDVLSFGEFMKDAKAGDCVTIAINDLTLKDRVVNDTVIAPRALTKTSFDEVYGKVGDRSKSTLDVYYPAGNENGVYHIDSSASAYQLSQVSACFEEAGYTAEDMFNDYVSVGLIPVPTEKLRPDVLGANNCSFTEADGKLTITSYTGTSQNVVIPAEIDGKPVTAIAQKAFSQFDIHAVTTAANLETIESQAFAKAYFVTDINLSETVMNIGENAFNNATVTDETDGFVTLADTILLSYTGTSSDIVVPEGIKHIGAKAFSGPVTSVTLPEGLVSIGEGAFMGKKLTTVNFPSTLLRIGTDAFNNATDLTAINLPANLIEVGDSAFKGCTGVSAITLNENLKTIGNNSFVYCSITEITIPDSVVALGNEAFLNCQTLETVNGGANVATVGYDAFYASPWFTNLCAENEFAMFGDGVLLSCSLNEEEVVLPAEVKCIAGAFKKDKPLSKVKTLKVNDGCLYISEEAFQSLNAVTDITIPASVVSIGTNAIDAGRAGDIVLHVAAGSAAETYAKANYFTNLDNNI